MLDIFSNLHDRILWAIGWTIWLTYKQIKKIKANAGVFDEYISLTLKNTRGTYCMVFDMESEIDN